MSVSKPERQHTDRTIKEKIEILGKLDCGVKAVDLCKQFNLSHFYLFFLHRLIKEITYREFQRYHNKPVIAPVISDTDYASGTVVKCPMKWTRGACEALH